jgi:large subunit ribosomal protein L21
MDLDGGTTMASENRYAIIKTGGKQYRVSQGDVIYVELLQAEQGSNFEFKEVLLLKEGSTSKVGVPFVPGCTVKAELLGEVRGPKVIAVKYKRRKNQRSKVGHRQNYHRVKITAIEGGVNHGT